MKRKDLGSVCCAYRLKPIELVFLFVSCLKYLPLSTLVSSILPHFSYSHQQQKSISASATPCRFLSISIELNEHKWVVFICCPTKISRDITCFSPQRSMLWVTTVLAISSRVRGFGENVRPSIPRLHLFVLKWRLAHAHQFHFLRQDQRTRAQWAETTVAQCVLTSYVWARLLIGPHAKSGQRHSQPTSTSLGQGCMRV